jgi:hypothetical protein
MINGIVFVIRYGLRWRDAPRDYGPHKTIYNRFVRWSRLGVFNKILRSWRARPAVAIGLAVSDLQPQPSMITKINYSGYRFPPEIIQKAIWCPLLAHPGNAALR